MYVCMYMYIYIYAYNIFVVEISEPYVCNRLIPSNRKWCHIAVFHWYWRLAKLRYQYTGHVACMGKNCIPNWILHGEIKEGCHKQGVLTQENFQRRAQEQPAQVWSIDLCNWEKYDQHASTNISGKLGKNKVKKSVLHLN
jgi:hypothetical protein